MNGFWLRHHGLVLAIASLLVGGCSLLHRGHGDPTEQRGLDNPLFVPVADRELLWNQLVDAMDDYFRIEREQRVQEVGGVLTEGKITTYPTTGASYLEPWHRDSTPGYERLHATFQSLRRRAEARVIPHQNGYYVEVIVYKELEDVSVPEGATVRGSVTRHDGTPAREEARNPDAPVTLGWICLGRDLGLEQQILAELYARLQK